MSEILEAPAREAQSAAPERLMNKNFVLLWQGQLVSQLGSQAFSIAMMFWIKHATESASLLGLIMMGSALPAVLLGPVGGTFADRHSRWRILVVADVVRGLLVTALAVTLFLVPSQTGPILVLLVVVAILVSVMDAFFRPAVTASIPDLVPNAKVPAANSLNKISVDTSTFLGQALGGLFYRLLGPATLFLIDGLSYLVAAVAALFIHIPQRIPERAKTLRDSFAGFRRDLGAGLSYVWRTPGTRAIVLVMPLFNALLVPIIVLFPFYVEDLLGKPSDWFGYLVAGFGAGALVGSACAGGIPLSGSAASRLVLASGILYGLGPLGLGLVRSPWAALAVIAFTGVMNGFMNVRIVSSLQRTTPSSLRGRVFGLMETLVFSLTPIAMGLAGVLADLTGKNVPAIFITCGLAISALALFLAASAPVRSFLAVEATVQEEAGAG